MNNRIKLHQELARVGLPASDWTEDYLDLYDVMNKEERTDLVDWLQMLKIDVGIYEEDMDFTDVGREKYMGMTFIEKAHFIGLHNLEIMRLERARNASDALKESSSTQATTTFGEPLERMKSNPEEISAPPQHPRSKSRKVASQLISFVEGAFNSAVDKVYSSRRSATTSGSGSKLLRTSDGSDDCDIEASSQGNLKLQRSSDESGELPSRFKLKPLRFSFDSGIDIMDDASSVQEVHEPDSDHSTPGLLTRVKSGFFVDRMAHFPQSLKHTDSVKKAKRSYRNSSFDSDAVSVKLGENMSTAKRAVFAAPTLVKISPPCSTHSVVVTEHQKPSVSSEEGPAYSSTATTAVAAVNNRTVRLKRSIAERLSSQFKYPIDAHSFNKEYVDVPEHQLAIARSHAELDAAARKDPLLKPRSSYWTLRPLQRRKSTERQISTDFGKPFDTVTTCEGNGNGKGKRTLRKRISTIFGTVIDREKEKDGESMMVKRKLFGRKAIPEWEFSK